jgi:hypothetical protein
MSDYKLPPDSQAVTNVGGRGYHRPRRKPQPVSDDGEFMVPMAVPLRKPSPPPQAGENDEPVALPGHKPRAPVHAKAAPNAKATVNAKAGMIGEFAEAARAAGRIAQVPFADVLAKAGQESNYNPRARSSSSSAAGPYQFIEQTWLDLLKRHGSAYGLGPEVAQIKSHAGVASVADPALRKRLLELRHDIHLSAGMAARYLDEVGRDLGRVLHRKPSDDERRIAYFLGPGGAAKLIRAAQTDPGGLAAEVVPQAAEANRPMFYGQAGSLSNHEAMQRITRFVSRNLKDAAALLDSEQPVISDRMNEGTPVG